MSGAPNRRPGTRMTVKPAYPLVLGLALLLVAACGRPIAGEAFAGSDVRVTATFAPVRPSPRTSASRPRPPASTRPSTSEGPAALAGLVGTWEGEYTCAQGST